MTTDLVICAERRGRTPTRGPTGSEATQRLRRVRVAYPSAESDSYRSSAREPELLHVPVRAPRAVYPSAESDSRPSSRMAAAVEEQTHAGRCAERLRLLRNCARQSFDHPNSVRLNFDCRRPDRRRSVRHRLRANVGAPDHHTQAKPTTSELRPRSEICQSYSSSQQQCCH
jgi:hypothetical protein